MVEEEDESRLEEGEEGDELVDEEEDIHLLVYERPVSCALQIEPGAWPSWCSVRVGDVLVVGSSPAGAVRSRVARGCAAASATEATVASRGEQGRAGVRAVRRAEFFSMGSVSGRVRRRPAGRNSAVKLPRRPRRWECHGGGHWRALLVYVGPSFFCCQRKSGASHRQRDGTHQSDKDQLEG